MDILKETGKLGILTHVENTNNKEGYYIQQLDENISWMIVVK
jgi:hypothetical protein